MWTLPNIITLKEAMTRELTSALALVTPAQALAARDTEINDYYWIRYASASALEQVVNPDTRAWLEGLRTRKGLEDYNTAKSYLKYAPVFGVDVSNLTLGVPEQSPGAAYPLLEHLNYNTDPSLIVDYINMVDATRVATPVAVEEIEEETAA